MQQTYSNKFGIKCHNLRTTSEVHVDETINISIVYIQNAIINSVFIHCIHFGKWYFSTFSWLPDSFFFLALYSTCSYQQESKWTGRAAQWAGSEKKRSKLLPAIILEIETCKLGNAPNFSSPILWNNLFLCTWGGSSPQKRENSKSCSNSTTRWCCRVSLCALSKFDDECYVLGADPRPKNWEIPNICSNLTKVSVPRESIIPKYR